MGHWCLLAVFPQMGDHFLTPKCTNQRLVNWERQPVSCLGLCFVEVDQSWLSEVLCAGNPALFLTLTYPFVLILALQ